jgi:hypothetical protein
MGSTIKMMYIRAKQLKHSSIFPFILDKTLPPLKRHELQWRHGNFENTLLPIEKFDITPDYLGMIFKKKVRASNLHFLAFYMSACFTAVNQFVEMGVSWHFVIACCSAPIVALVQHGLLLKEKERFCLDVSSLVTCSIIGDQRIARPWGPDINKNSRSLNNDNTKELMKTGKISGWIYVSLQTGKQLWISNNDLRKIALELVDDEPNKTEEANKPEEKFAVA